MMMKKNDDEEELMMTDSKRALTIPVLPHTFSFDLEIAATETTQRGGNTNATFCQPRIGKSWVVKWHNPQSTLTVLQTT